MPVAAKDNAMSTRQMNVQQVMMDQEVDMALEMTAHMFGLPKKTVTTIVQVGLPMMAQMAETNPELLRRMYAAALIAMPEPIQDFYTRMAQNPEVRQSAMDDYKATYGAMLDAVNREAARQAGTTDGQARDVMAAMLPAVSQVLAQANAVETVQGFAQQLHRLYEQGGS
jgi:hypothetical protein